jgi:hypothetical protein
MYKSIKALWSEKRVMTSVSDFALDLFNKGYELRRNGKVVSSLMEMMAEANPEELQVKIKAYPGYPAEWTENLQKLARKMYDEGFLNIIIYGPEKVGFTHHNLGSWLEVIYTRKPGLKKWNLTNEVETAAEPLSSDGRGRYSLAFWLNQDNALGKQQDDMKPLTKGAKTAGESVLVVGNEYYYGTQKVVLVDVTPSKVCRVRPVNKTIEFTVSRDELSYHPKTKTGSRRLAIKTTALESSELVPCEMCGTKNWKNDLDEDGNCKKCIEKLETSPHRSSIAKVASTIIAIAPEYKDYMQGVDFRDAQWYDTVIWKPGFCEECGSEQPQVHDQLCMLHHKKQDQDHYNRLEKAIQDRQAGVNKEADQLFMQGVTCPHCATRMSPILLVDGIKGVYCSTCRHTDYDPSIKNKVNAGNPSKEKTIKLQMKDPGSAVLAE